MTDRTGEMACGLNFSSQWFVPNLLPSFSSKGFDYNFIMQNKYGHRKQAWKGPDSDKNSTSRVSELTDEEHHSSNEHNEDTPDEEVCILAFWFFLLLTIHPVTQVSVN